MVRMEVLNIHKLNIYQVLNSMFNLKANTTPCIFENLFTDIQHQYSTINLVEYWVINLCKLNSYEYHDSGSNY